MLGGVLTRTFPRIGSVPGGFTPYACRGVDGLDGAAGRPRPAQGRGGGAEHEAALRARGRRSASGGELEAQERFAALSRETSLLKRLSFSSW